MEFIKNSLILISGFVVIGFLIEGLRYPGFALFLAYLFYFLTMYGLIYEANKNYEIKLSGSGSCMYIFYEKENDIKEILKKIPSNWRFFFCKPLQYSPICYIK